MVSWRKVFLGGFGALALGVAVAAAQDVRPDTDSRPRSAPEPSRVEPHEQEAPKLRSLPRVAPPTPFEQFTQTARDFLLNGNEDDGGSPFVRMEGGTIINEDTVRTARETVSHSTGTPEWTNPRGFEKDVFTFARIVFKTGISTARGHLQGKRIGWWVDYPDADLNLSYRLQQLTSIRTDPDARVLKLTDVDLPDYPFIFMEHPGYMRLKTGEVDALRKYLLNGGALVVMDFWNQREWDGFAREMKRALPEYSWTNLTTEHPLFHCVYDLRAKSLEDLQVPTMQFWMREGQPADAISEYSEFRGDGAIDPRVAALLDDKGRIMVLAFHNSDVSDGWEREGQYEAYFHQFSEKISYPLGINIVFYLMTH